MSLSDVSSVSLGRMFCYLKQDPRHIDSLRRTCKTFNKQAISMGLDKADDVYLSLRIERIRKDNSPMFFMGKRIFKKNVIRIKAVIKKKRRDTDPACRVCFNSSDVFSVACGGRSDSDVEGKAIISIFPGLPSLLDHASDSEDNVDKEDYPVGSGRKNLMTSFLRRLPVRPVPEEEEDNDSDKSEYIDIHAQMELLKLCTCKNWFPIAEHIWEVARISERNQFIETFATATKRVRSIQKLKIKCWRLKDESISYLTQQYQLRSLQKLVLFHCRLNVEKDTFLQFIRSIPIKKARINCKFLNYQLSDEALYNIHTLYVVHVYGKSQLEYPRLTDRLLEHWEQTPPIKAEFSEFTTNFTIRGIIRLLETSSNTKCGATYKLGILSINRRDYRELMNYIHGRRKLKWRYLPNLHPGSTPNSVWVTQDDAKFAMNFHYKLTNQ